MTTDATWPQPSADSVAVGAFTLWPSQRNMLHRCAFACCTGDTLQTGGLAEPHTKAIAYEW